MPGREKIDAARALRIFEEVGDWNKVSQVLTHATGQPFQTNSICQAVRRHKREVAAIVDTLRDAGVTDAQA